MTLLALAVPTLLSPALAEEDRGGPDVPAWLAAAAVCRVHIDEAGAATLTLDYTFQPLRHGWMDVRLVGSELAVTRTDGPVLPEPDGLHLILGTLHTPVQVEVVGSPRTETPGAARIPVLPAARQEVVIDAPGWDVEVAGAVGGGLSGRDILDVRWVPHQDRARSSIAPLVAAETSTAVWGEEGALQVRARVRWRVLHGEVARFRLAVTGLDDLELTGGNVARWSREGEEVTVEARAPVRGGFEVEVSARAALPADAPAPSPTPLDVRRLDRYWTVARSEEGELLPVSGPRSVSMRALPAWARGMSEAAPLASWRGNAPLVLRAARYAPMMGPDTVIESAEFVLANSAEGRELLRSVWLVRNERRQYLHVRPAPGWRPLTARVSGAPVSVLSDGTGGLYVPLEKSVETIQGLMSFPVEVTWIASHDSWRRRGSRRFELPAVDAPIQSAAWEVHLPRTLTPMHEDAVTVASVYDPRKEAARDSWLQALSAYKDNRFDEAQGWLDQARSYDVEDNNVERLQSNLDVLLEEPQSTEDDRSVTETSPMATGGDVDGDAIRDEVDRGETEESDEEDTRSDVAEGKPEDLVVRRVRELANAKTTGQQLAQAEAEENAKKALLAGDEDAAADYLQTVVDLSRQIGATVQKEDRGQADKLNEAMKNLESVQVRKAEKQKAVEYLETTTSRSVSFSHGSEVESGLVADPFAEPASGAGPTPPAGNEGQGEEFIVDGVVAYGGVRSQPEQTILTGEEAQPAVDTPYPIEQEIAFEDGEVESGPAGEGDHGLSETSDAGIVDGERVLDTEAAQQVGVEYLARIPIGRTFASAVSVVAGTTGKAGGRSRNENKATAGKSAPAPAATSPATIPPSTVAPPPPPAPPGHPAADPAPDPRMPIATPPMEAPLPSIPASASAPRRALDVKASPLTPALPLDGAVVHHADALLAADTFPTLTVRYRTRKDP